MATDAPASGTALAPQRTFFDDVLDSIVTPGASSGLVAAINASLLALVLTLVVLVATGAADVHTGVLLFLALGLLGSVNFFVSALRSAEAAKQAEEGEGEVAATDGGEAAPAGTGLAPAANGTNSGGDDDDEPPAPDSGKSPRSGGSGARRRRRD